MIALRMWTCGAVYDDDARWPHDGHWCVSYTSALYTPEEEALNARLTAIEEAMLRG